MAYSDFTLDEAIETFGLTLRQVPDLFAGTPPVEPGPLLAAILAESLPLVAGSNTEKAKSELVVMPVLLALRLHLEHAVSVFSGITFDVDSARGLVGRCDFLISRSPEQLRLRAPVATVVEAKNDSLPLGFGQCVATLVAAQVFNARGGRPVAVHGAVTTGSLWQFLRLDGTTVMVDLQEYHIRDAARLFGVLTRIAAG